MRKKYDRIYSLGMDCRPKIAMRDTQLGCKRSPFDWFGMKSFSRLVLLIENDFTPLFPKAQIEIRQIDNKPVMYDRANKIYAIHEFPDITDLDREFDALYPEFSKKYQGIASQMQSDIRQVDEILFILNLQNKWENNRGLRCIHDGTRFDEKIKELMTILAEKRGGKPFDLFIATYFEELCLMEWPENIMFFKKEKTWPQWGSDEETQMWNSMMLSVDVKEDVMRKGWGNHGRPSTLF